ncbi:DUF2887 domain-containing protein [Halochromatium sp.]
MKTDHPIYLFLRSGPEAFRVLTGGLQLDGAYRVCSLTIKSLERRLDGLVAPEGHAGPAYVVEFQAQPWISRCTIWPPRWGCTVACARRRNGGLGPRRCSSGRRHRGPGRRG